MTEQVQSAVVEFNARPANVAAPDPEVVAMAKRRRFSAADKRRILKAADACSALGALVRREGIYSSYLTAWRKQREAAYPETPTMIEAGFPKVMVTGWGGLLAPVGTPQEIVQKAQRDTARHTCLRRNCGSAWSALGAEPAATTPEQFAAFIKAEWEKWSGVARQAGIYHSQ